MTFEERISFKKVLKIVCIDYSIGDVDDLIIDRCINHIEKNYRITAPQVMEAFEMNSTGKNWEIIEGYNDLTTVFISKILNKYKQFKGEKLAKKWLNDKQIESGLTRQEFEQNMFNRQVDRIQLYSNKDHSIDWDFVYDYARKCGMYHNDQEYNAVLKRETKEDDTDFQAESRTKQFLFRKYYP